MRSKLVSVIIPSFNRVYTLDRAISSVKAQSYKNIEIILINDCSTDFTDIFLENYDFWGLRHQIIKNTVNLWISASRNIWIEKSQGEYIAFLDSDDEWINVDKIKLQVGFLINNPEYWFVGTLCNSTIPHPIQTQFMNIQEDKDFRNIALSYFFIHINTWLLRADTIKRVGYFWNYRVEDYEYLLRIWLFTKYWFLPFSSACYHNETQGDHTIKIFLTRIIWIYIIFKYSRDYPYFLRHLFGRIFRIFPKILLHFFYSK